MSVRHSNEDLSNSGSAAICTICKVSLGNERPLAVTHCKHTFHRTCARSWLGETQNCPTCKTPCLLSQVDFPDQSAELLLNLLSSDEGNRDAQGGVDDANRNTGTKPKSKSSRGKTTFGRPVTRSMNFQGNLAEAVMRDSNCGTQRVKFTDKDDDRNQCRSENRSQVDYDLIRNIVCAEQERNFRGLAASLNDMIERQVRACFDNMTISESPRGSNISEYDWPREMPSMGAGVRNFSSNRDDHPSVDRRNTHTSNRTRCSVVPEKVSSLIQNWHLKFDGSKDGISTDEFVYRVEALTRQNLEGNFELLCDNLHVLLFGKADRWFWKFHRRNPRFDWDTFRFELHRKFDDNLSDLDIWERIRKRRQKESETFEDYQTAVEELVEKLSSVVCERDLVEILLRNSKPGLRYELLHLRIDSLARLREEVGRHETFFSESYPQASRMRGFRGNISAIQDSDGDDIFEDDVVADMQHRNGNVTCWNCDSKGHRYDDCLEPRRIFCYGCGTKDVFKPRCRKCNPSENRRRDAATNTKLSHPDCPQ